MNDYVNNIYGSANINLDLLELFWFTKKELDFFAFSKIKKYKIIKIPKKNGNYRTLHSPVFKLKNAQRFILNEILYNKTNFLLPDNITWFIPNKSIKDNAKFHIWKKYILKIDIKDFFPSITKDRVYALFRKEFDFDHETSMYLSSICCFNNQLPQWAPTSPMLSNFIARFIDYKLLWLLNKYNVNKAWLDLTYSRYADDLTFSFNKKIDFNKIINYIISILIEEWFFPNYRKIHLISSWKQQRVTWIIVNNKIWVWRKYYKKFKSIFYNISKKWFREEMIKRNTKNNRKIYNEENFKEILWWYLSYIKSISPEYYTKLLKFNIGLK